MYTDVSGNIGIHVTAPKYTLEMIMQKPTDGVWLRPGPDGKTAVGLLNNMDNGAYNALTLAGDNMLLFKSKSKIDDPNAGGLVLGPWSSRETGIRITPTGRVGIGIRAPHKTLHVVGESRYDGDGMWLTTSGGGTTDVALLNNVGSGAFNGLSQGGDSMLLLFGSDPDKSPAGLVLGPWSAGATGIRIASTGYVGIGTPWPKYMLDVEGDVQAKAYHTGDIYFQKDGQTLWRMFEDQAGLYVESLTTGKKYNVMLQEMGSKGATNADTSMVTLQAENAALKQKMADLEAKLDALAQKLP